MARTILICDDERGIVDLFREVLEEEHYRVLTAHDGREGLRRVREARPDLVLSNVQMPHMDGTEMARAIRADPALDTMPIVLMSGAATRAEGVPCDAFFQKPFRVDDLLAEIARLLDAAQEARHLAPSP
jgi:two-component system response regulator VicR